SVEVGWVAGIGELVEHHDVVATSDQAPYEVRADEAGSAGDQHFHGSRRLDETCLQPGEALAQPVAPVRELRCIRALAPENGVRRPRRGPLELRSGDAANGAVDPGLLEDGLGELRPGAVSRCRQVPDAAGVLAVDKVAH